MMIVRTAEDESPYSEKTSVYFLSYQKSVAGLGTQSQVSQRLFCFFFLRLKKEDNEQPMMKVPAITLSVGYRRHLSRRARL